jgi:solute carrier family 35 protein F5
MFDLFCFCLLSNSFIIIYFYLCSFFFFYRSSTVLSSTASVFTFLFALLWGEETFNRWKLLGVIMAFSGSALTSIHDADNSDNGGDILDDEPFQSQLWGDGAGLISAVGYGVYSVLLRLLCHDESRISMNLFLGYIGLFNMITLSPFLIWSFRDAFHDDSDVNYYYEGNDNDNDRHEYVLRYLSSQNLSWFILFCLIVKGLFDNVLSDFLWAKSILLTSATVATVGLGLTIPLALLSDLFIMDRSDVLSVESLTGAMLVLLGFIFVNIGEDGKDDDDSSIDDKLDFEAISLQDQIS